MLSSHCKLSVFDDSGKFLCLVTGKYIELWNLCGGMCSLYVDIGFRKFNKT